MEIRYLRNLSGSRMLIKQIEKGRDWEQEMLLCNPLEELLIPNPVSENGEEILWYDITGRQALDVVLDTETLDYEMLRQLCGAVVSAAERLEGLLLSPDAILLNPECIFIDNQKSRVSLCYCPGNPVALGDAFHELMQYLLKKLNHKDMEAVEAGYRLFEETAKEGYSVTEIPKCLSTGNFRKEKVPIRQNMEMSEIQENGDTGEEREISKGVERIKRKEERKNKGIKERLQTWLTEKKQGILKYLPKKREKEKEVFVFEPEEQEEVRQSRPTVLLSEISRKPQGILKYEGNGECRDMKIGQTPYIIGNDEACDGRIESDTVSRRHAKITKTEDIYFIEDLNSSNGTYVGGELLNCRVKMSLQCNETVVFADEKFRFI